MRLYQGGVWLLVLLLLGDTLFVQVAPVFFLTLSLRLDRGGGGLLIVSK